MPESRLLLASGSKTRAGLLTAAGVTFEVIGSAVDEDGLKASLRAEGASLTDIVVALAEMKALHGSVRFPGDLVIGADQILELDGELFSKPTTLEKARSHLERLRGKDHQLRTAIILARGGERIWSHHETAHLRMREFSDTFLDQYCGLEAESLLETVGAYKVEGSGIQLFARITGDHAAILGLPLIPLLAQLRELGVLTV